MNYTAALTQLKIDGTYYEECKIYQVYIIQQFDYIAVGITLNNNDTTLRCDIKHEPINTYDELEEIMERVILCFCKKIADDLTDTGKENKVI